MKLQDKETGEIWTLINRNEGTSAVLWVSNGSRTRRIESIEELTSRFEDYEEPKELWFIAHDGSICSSRSDLLTKEFEKIGLAFETEEEAEKAVEKLKAWKRLKDKGFKFVGWEDTNNDVNDILFELPYMEWDKNVSDDLDSLFGGKE